MATINDKNQWVETTGDLEVSIGGNQPLPKYSVGGSVTKTIVHIKGGELILK